MESARPNKFSPEILTAENNAVSELAKRLKAELFDDNESIPESGLLADMINAAFGEVDWRDLARHYIDNAVDNGAEYPKTRTHLAEEDEANEDAGAPAQMKSTYPLCTGILANEE